MHESHGIDLLTGPEPPDPEPRPTRPARYKKGFVAALVAAALVLLCANGAMAYFSYQISLNEKTERVEPAR